MCWLPKEYPIGEMPSSWSLALSCVHPELMQKYSEMYFDIPFWNDERRLTSLFDVSPPTTEERLWCYDSNRSYFWVVDMTDYSWYVNLISRDRGKAFCRMVFHLSPSPPVYLSQLPVYSLSAPQMCKCTYTLLVSQVSLPLACRIQS